MAELADAIDLGSISKEWEFKSLYPHQKTGQNLFPRFCPVFMFYNLSVFLKFRYASFAPYVSIKTPVIFSQLSAGTLLNSKSYPRLVRYSWGNYTIIFNQIASSLI